ncbi:MAG: hypothetical protein Q7J36_06735 [Thiobacillus sp.]|nr:hypothetical protein [Thiobacillus sp.]
METIMPTRLVAKTSFTVGRKSAALSAGCELGCFVAGTLVHTKEGLRPIEQIKVGDYVLSKPESGEGEPSYQRVTQTYEYEDKAVYFAAWTVEDLGVPRMHPVDRSQWERGYVVVTGAHPFRVKHVTALDEESLLNIVHEVNAWLSIDEMIKMDQDRRSAHGGIGFNFYVELADGRVASLVYFEAILQHRQPDLGIGFKRDPRSWDLRGTSIRFTKDGPVATLDCNGWSYIENALYEDDAVDYDYDNKDSLVTQSMGFLPMRRKVFNIEVENTHTYYVGEPGVWVHNING